MKPIAPIGIWIIFLTLPLCMAVAEKENMTTQDDMIIQKNLTMPDIPMSKLAATNVNVNVPKVVINITNDVLINVTNNIQNLSSSPVIILDISIPKATHHKHK